MPQTPFSRREFARAFGATFAAAWVSPKLFQGVARGGPGGPPGDGIIRLNYNENPYGPSREALEAITQSESVACRYPDDLRAQATQAIAELHGVPTEQIALGCGSTEILRACDAAFVGPGKNLVVAEPTFEAVVDYAKAGRGGAVKIPLTPDFRHDLPRMAAACTPATGLVYVCNPNNPTGTIVTRDEFAAFVKAVPASTMILVDEAYFHFVEDPRYASAADLIAKHPNLIVARTFSKVYGLAGMRLGYGVGNAGAIQAVRRQLLEDNGNAAVLPAAMASLGDPDRVLRTRKLLNDTRRWIVAALAGDGRRVIPSEANFIMIEIGRDVEPVIERFRAQKILVGRKFPSMPDWLRVTIGKPEEMETFLEALRGIVPAQSARAA